MDRSDRVLAYITSYIQEKGYPPTVRQISAGAGLNSTGVVHYYLQKLEANGRIEREFKSPRAIRVLDGAAKNGLDT